MKTKFIRLQNNSLKKDLNKTNVWALLFGSIIGAGAFIMPGNTFLANAGPLGTSIAMTIAALIMIIIAINYYYMVNKFPSSGGEFTYTDITFGKRHAFICSWFLALSYISIVSYNATATSIIGKIIPGNIFQFGFHYIVAGYDVYFGEVLISELVLLLFAILCIKGVKISGFFQTILAFVLAGGVIFIFFCQTINGNYALTGSPLFQPSKGIISGITSVVVVSPWAFVGFDTVPQASEELNFSTKKTISIIVLSILFSAMIYIMLTLTTSSIIPSNYTNWIDYINESNKLEGLISLPTFNAAYILLGNFGLITVGLAALAAALTGVNGFYMASSRLLYSMSLKNVIPSWFSSINSTSRTPKNAILFVMLVSMIAPFFGRVVIGWIVDMSSIGAAIAYFYTSLSSFVHSRKEHNVKMMIFGLAGSLLSLLFVLLLLVPIKELGCSFGKEQTLCLAVWSIIGVIFYKSMRNKNSEN